MAFKAEYGKHSKKARNAEHSNEQAQQNSASMDMSQIARTRQLFQPSWGGIPPPLMQTQQYSTNALQQMYQLQLLKMQIEQEFLRASTNPLLESRLPLHEPRLSTLSTSSAAGASPQQLPPNHPPSLSAAIVTTDRINEVVAQMRPEIARLNSSTVGTAAVGLPANAPLDDKSQGGRRVPTGALLSQARAIHHSRKRHSDGSLKDNAKKPAKFPRPKPKSNSAALLTRSSSNEGEGLRRDDDDDDDLDEIGSDRKMPAASKMVLLALDTDKEVLTKYQALIRQHVYLFAVTDEDMKRSAKGRNKPIVVGQVGVLCKHCAQLKPWQRPSGSCYFPSQLSGIYQSVQNMVSNHFMETCTLIPAKARDKIRKLKDRKQTLWGGGRQYWVHGGKLLGVVEHESYLAFAGENEGEAKDNSGTPTNPPPPI